MLAPPRLVSHGQAEPLLQILDVPTEALSDLMAGLDEHVQLVGYRELMDLARQKRLLEEQDEASHESAPGMPATHLQLGSWASMTH